MDETPATAERKLWRAVLEQAFDEAELPKCDETGFEPVARKQARRFLRADSPHEQANLELVCDFADIPLDRVIPWARKRYPIARPGGQARPGEQARQGGQARTGGQAA